VSEAVRLVGGVLFCISSALLTFFFFTEALLSGGGSPYLRLSLRYVVGGGVPIGQISFWASSD